MQSEDSSEWPLHPVLRSLLFKHFRSLNRRPCPQVTWHEVQGLHSLQESISCLSVTLSSARKYKVNMYVSYIVISVILYPIRMTTLIPIFSLNHAMDHVIQRKMIEFPRYVFTMFSHVYHQCQHYYMCKSELKFSICPILLDLMSEMCAKLYRTCSKHLYLEIVRQMNITYSCVE